ncbi:MAG: electron transport complex subunit E [Magnetococcales bacterium]|nr:electron transport complex subunit E [Magnetococcales bacterium]NGZ25446.1 electron transport complex subunit E [Magnetococcales bacterium]
MSSAKDLIKEGLWSNNPVFVQMLGMCPTLAVSSSAINGLAMGIAVIFVLMGSNIAISMLRKVIPNDVRIPAFIVVIATFVTVVDLMMNAFVHDLHKVLGIFIPLIVVNCIILGRAEAFAYGNGVLMSALDGFVQGLGFTFALVLLGSIREFLGAGTIFGIAATGDAFHPALTFILPPGAFIALGFIMMAFNWINSRKTA